VLVDVADLIGKEPIPELGIISVRIEDRVGQVGLLQLRIGER